MTEPKTTVPHGRAGRLLSGSMLGAGVLLALALLVLGNVLLWRFHLRSDWTATGIYSLSETTENVLAGLDRDVEAIAFVTPGHRLYEPVRELLERYEAASPHLTVRWVDPEREPVEAARVAESHELAAESVVFVLRPSREALSGDGTADAVERRVVDVSGLAEIDLAAAQRGESPEITSFTGEDAFTSVLVDLTQGERPLVVFTTGHGERSLDDVGAGGLAAVEELLGDGSVELREWASLGAEAVPAGTDLLVLAGPEAAFVETELALFDDHLAGGGSLLVLVDPVAAAGGERFADLGLGAWLAARGIELPTEMVVDPAWAPQGFSGETFYVPRYGDHPVTEGLARGEIPVLVRQARPVRPGPRTPGRSATVLLRSSDTAWAVDGLGVGAAEPPAGAASGPFPLAVAVEPAPRGDGAVTFGQDAEGAGEAGDGEPATAPSGRSGGKIAVVGDSDFVSSAFLLSGPGNAALANNLFNWLVERRNLLGIPPKAPEQVRLAMTPAELRGALLLVVVAMPLLALGLGGAVWWRRRRP